MLQGPFPQGLRLGAFVWLLTLGLTAGFMYMLEVEYGAPAWLWQISLGLAIGMGLVLLVASMLFKTAPILVLWRSTFVGVMLFPMVAFAGTAGLSFIAASPPTSRPWLWLFAASTTTVWCLIALSGYKQRVIDRRFIEREFSIEEARILVRHPLKTDLDPDPIEEHTLFGKLYYRFGPYLFFGIPLAYPLQRLVTDTAGGGSTLLLLALLAWPLTLYILGRMTCGAYLWIYRVWQMQRQYGKPVVFADAR